LFEGRWHLCQDRYRDNNRRDGSPERKIVKNPRPEDVALFGAPGRGPKASCQVPGLLE